MLEDQSSQIDQLPYQQGYLLSLLASIKVKRYAEILAKATSFLSIESTQKTVKESGTVQPFIEMVGIILIYLNMRNCEISAINLESTSTQYYKSENEKGINAFTSYLKSII